MNDMPPDEMHPLYPEHPLLEAKEKAERPLDAATCSQCIVHKCVNHRHQGRFIGDMCAPCYIYITTGKVGPTASFLSRMDVLRTIAASDWKTAGELRKMARDANASANAKTEGPPTQDSNETNQ